MNKSLASQSKDFRGFKGWLSSENFYLNTPIEPKNFSVFVRDPEEFKQATAQESFRMGLNSLQSMYEIRKNPAFPKLSSWHVIQAYYAAFFAAHSTLRIFGEFFTNFENGHSKIIAEHALREHSVTCAINSGNFHAVFDPSSNVLSFNFEKESHRDLWKVYCRLLDRLSIEVLLVRGTKEVLTDISTSLSDLRDLLHRGKGKDSGNWLSIFRNEVNYKSTSEAWYPFTGNQTETEKVFSFAKKWRDGTVCVADCLAKSSDMEVFFLTSILVVQVSNQLLSDYASVAGTKNKYANLYQKFEDLARTTFDV